MSTSGADALAPTDLLRALRKRRPAVVTATSGLLYVVGWGLGQTAASDAASAAILVLAAVVGGYDVAKRATYEVRSRTLGIETLVTIAAIGAIAIGEYWEAAAVVFLFSLGRYLEGRTTRKTRAALRELLELSPDTAIVRRDGEEREVPAREVEAGEVVVVEPGATVPVDGDVVAGESAVDQAPVTGESAPVTTSEGDEVYAGTINQAGALEVVATGTGSDTTLQRIVRRVEEAQEDRAPSAKLIDRFGRYYTPAVVVLAVGAYAVTRDVLLALTLLVVACPGALVIGPPVSVVSAIGNAARKGVLAKGGEHLERAATIDLVAFDKTGTLTTGETTVADVQGFGVADDEALRLAAVAEKRSEHHLAGAILDAARDRGGSDDGARVATDGGASRDAAIDRGAASESTLDAAATSDRAHDVADRALGASSSDRPDAEAGERAVARPDPVPDPDAFEVLPGKGVVAEHGGSEIVVGNRALLAERGVAIPDDVAAAVREREAAGETAVHVVRDGTVVGVIALRDELRAAAPDVVASLREAGVRTVMLTGDNERTAAAVAEAVGVDEYRAGLLPEEKQTAIDAYRDAGHVVAMVGDGINDAPSLATADVGIAMGAAGTDTAIETADVALLADDLERIPYALRLSAATRRNVLENVGIAVVTVAVLLGAVLTGTIHLAGGMLVHEASVLFVVLNAMRLLRY